MKATYPIEELALFAETERDICKRAGIDPCRVNWQAGMAEEVLRPEVEKK